MERVSVRNFQLKPTQYLPQIPIVLTQYNRDVAMVVPIGFNMTDNSTENAATTTIVTPKPVVEENWEHSCEAPGIQCLNFGKQYNITYTDEEGEKHITSFLCQNHVAQATLQADLVEEV